LLYRWLDLLTVVAIAEDLGRGSDLSASAVESKAADRYPLKDSLNLMARLPTFFLVFLGHCTVSLTQCPCTGEQENSM
jgi:hypothetical protein